MTIFEKKELEYQNNLTKILTNQVNSTLAISEPFVSKISVKNLERYLKWEKQKVQKEMNNLIYQHAVPLTETLIDIAISERNPNAINSLLDRGFGKARQNIGLDGGAEDKPIVFLPAELMAKYSIEKGVYVPKEKNEEE
jgi:hypothetical protein